jgi:hypothetical protein
MRFRRGLILVAALSMAAGCGAVEPTTQTSMLRGPTPSSGMSIPQLFQIPSPSTGAQQDAQPVDPAASVAPATEESPTDAPISEIPSTGVTDEFSTLVPDDTVVDTTAGTAQAGGPDLSALAASFSCADYTVQPDPEPTVAAWGTCVLDDQQILLYAFADDQSTADYAASLESSGVTTEEMVTGPGYLIWADAGPIAKVKAALGAG